MVKIRNVSPLGELVIPHLDLIVGADEEFDVSADEAGTPPTPAIGEPEDDDYVPATLGTGLLAQFDNFVPVTAKAAAAKAPKEAKL